jgi:hypothetical protein
LSAEEQRASGFTHKWNIGYADLVTAGAATTTAAFTLFDGVAGLMVTRAAVNVITAFDSSDASTNANVLIVGDSTDPNRFVAGTETHVDGSEVLWYVAPYAVDTLPYAYLTALDITCLFTVAGGTPFHNELTAGEVEIYLHLFDLNKLEAS